MADDTNYSTRKTAGTLAGTEVIPVWKDVTNSNRSLRTTVADVATYVMGNISSGEFAVLDTVVAGTVTASKVIVVDANKDIASFRKVTTTAHTTTDSLDTAATMTASADTFPAATLVKLNSTTPAIIKSFAIEQGKTRVITQMDAGTAGHVITMTGGTFDGTNNTATFGGQYQSISVYGVAAGKGLLLANQGVTLSSV